MLTDDGKHRTKRCTDVQTEHVGERRPFDELEDQRVNPARVLEAANRADVGVVERCQNLRLSLKARAALWIPGEDVRQHLECDAAPKRGVLGAKDSAHAAGAEDALDPVDADGLADGERGWLPEQTVGDPHRLVERADRLILGEQRLHLLSQRRIAGAGFGQKRVALSATSRAASQMAAIRCHRSGFMPTRATDGDPQRGKRDLAEETIILRTKSWHDRGHFFAVSARIMRRILVDAARAQATSKRGGAADHVAHASTIDFDRFPSPDTDRPAERCALDDALASLAAIDPRRASSVARLQGAAAARCSNPTRISFDSRDRRRASSTRDERMRYAAAPFLEGFTGGWDESRCDVPCAGVGCVDVDRHDRGAADPRLREPRRGSSASHTHGGGP